MSEFNVATTTHTGITVADLDRALSFYRDVLGFEVTEKHAAPGHLIDAVTGLQGAQVEIANVHAPGHVIELLCYSKPDDRRISDLRPCDSGFVHVAFQVDDLNAVLRAVGDAGFSVMGEAHTVAQGARKGGRVAYARDPDGTVLEFQQPPPG